MLYVDDLVITGFLASKIEMHCANTFNRTIMVISKIYMSMVACMKDSKHSLIGVTWNDAPESTIQVCDKASF